MSAVPKTTAWPLAAMLLTASAISVSLPLSVVEAAQPAEPAKTAAPAPRTRALPDLARGQRAAAAGRLEAAEADLLPLARRGYLEAQIALGKLYARMGTPDRIEAAIRWLRAANGSAPQLTAVSLGRLLARQSDEAALREANDLLSWAYDQRADVDALGGLLRLYTEHPQFDRERRVARLAARAEALNQPETWGALVAWYKSAPQVDNNPQRLLTLCEKALDVVPECYLDLAREAHRRHAQARLKSLVDKGLVAYDQQLLNPQQLSAFARLLLSTPGDDPNDPVARLAALDVKLSDVEEDEGEQVLKQALSTVNPTLQGCEGPSLPAVTAAAPANGTATAAATEKLSATEQELASRLLARMLKDQGLAPVLASGVIARFPDLLPNADIEAQLKKGAEANIAEARLYLGTLYLQGQRARRDPQQTLRYLQQAAEEPLTASQAHYFLGRLYQYGYLDESSPQLAVKHLLLSARRGYAPADNAMARLFSAGKGLCPNLVDAYVFAQLAVAGGNVETSPLLEQISTRLDQSELARAEQRLQAERAVRPAAPVIGYVLPPPARPAPNKTQNKNGDAS